MYNAYFELMFLLMDALLIVCVLESVFADTCVCFVCSVWLLAFLKPSDELTISLDVSHSALSYI